MIGLILVSHSQKIAQGLSEMIAEMVGDSPEVVVKIAAGASDGRLGTDTLLIHEQILTTQDCQHILIFTDIGSSILSAELAKELIEDETIRQKVQLVKAPLVEGAFAAAVQASVNQDLGLILEELALV